MPSETTITFLERFDKDLASISLFKLLHPVKALVIFKTCYENHTNFREAWNREKVNQNISRKSP